MGLDLLGLPPWLRPRRKMTRQVALALGYDPQRDGAPEVLAKGRGAVAEVIGFIYRMNARFSEGKRS